jgi:predicted protein tyrosine phosphatase
MTPKVLSQEMVEHYECDEPHVLISICSPGSDGAVLPENPNRLETLRLCFHDIVADDFLRAGIDPEDLGLQFLRRYNVEPTFFSEENANAIAELLDRHPGKHVIVNCEAGISRSAGVAAAIAFAKTGDDEFYFRNYFPNKQVYSMTVKRLGYNGEINPKKWDFDANRDEIF